MQAIVMYQPICREALELMFESAPVAQSFRKLSDTSWYIEMRDTKILKRFQIPHTAINRNDIIETKREYRY